MIRRIKIYMITLLLISIGIYRIYACDKVESDAYEVGTIEDNNTYEGYELPTLEVSGSADNNNNNEAFTDAVNSLVSSSEALEGSLVGVGYGLTDSESSTETGTSDGGLTGFDDLLVDYTNSTGSTQSEIEEDGDESTTNSTASDNSTTDPSDNEPKEVVCDSNSTEKADADSAENRLNMLDSAYNKLDSTTINSLKNLAKNDTVEHSISIRYYSPTDIRKTNLATGTTTSSNVDVNSPYTVAIIHTHPGATNSSVHNFTGPSGGDLLALLQAHYGAGCSNLNDSYMVAYDGSEYVLHIADVSLAQTLYNSINNSDYYDTKGNPVVQNGDFTDGTDLYSAYTAARDKFTDEGFSLDDAHDAAMSAVLNSSGVTLLKKDANSTAFKQYTTTPIKNSKGKTTGYQSTKCK